MCFSVFRFSRIYMFVQECMYVTFHIMIWGLASSTQRNSSALDTILNMQCFNILLVVAPFSLSSSPHCHPMLLRLLIMQQTRVQSKRHLVYLQCSKARVCWEGGICFARAKEGANKMLDFGRGCILS